MQEREAVGSEPDLGLYRVLNDDGSADPRTDPHLSGELALRAYREMKRLRLLDARMILLQRQGRVGFYGACTGQEATPIAAALAIEPGDWVFQALRESVMMLVRGFPLTQYVAQVFGNSGDILKGRQMPSHMSGRSVNHVSWSSCLGPQLPQAVGAAWAAKIRGDRTVVLGFVGDGATSEPDFHAAMNFAAVFKTPSVLICQNNHWAISVPASRQTASATFAIKGRAYGILRPRRRQRPARRLPDRLRGDGPRPRGRGPHLHRGRDVPDRRPLLQRRPHPLPHPGRGRGLDGQGPARPPPRLRRPRGRPRRRRDAALEQELNAEIAAAIAAVEPPQPRLPARRSSTMSTPRLPWHLAEQREELLRGAPAPAHPGGGH